MSHRSFALCLLFVFLPYMFSCTTTRDSVVAPVAEIPDTSWSKHHFSAANDIVKGAELSRLHEAELSAGHKEVRVWIGGGHGWPQNMYRFVIEDERIHGERFWYWPAAPLKINGLVEDRIYERMKTRCDEVGYGRRYGACRQVFAVEPDWRLIYEKLTILGLWILPDESTLVPPVDFLVLDGWSITVELRDGRRYRIYEHDNPKTKPWPEAKNAVKMAEVLWEHL